MACIVLMALIDIVLIKLLLLLCGMGTEMSKKLKIYTLVTLIFAVIAIPIVCLNFKIESNGFFELLGIILGIFMEGLDIFLYDKYLIRKEGKKK